MILYLYSISQETHIELIDQEGRISFSDFFVMASSQTEELLSTIDKVLAKNNSDKKSLSAIVVNDKAGSYTGMRVIITTANFMAFSLNIPVIRSSDYKFPVSVRTFSSPVMPFYSGEPFITKTKARL